VAALVLVVGVVLAVTAPGGTSTASRPPGPTGTGAPDLSSPSAAVRGYFAALQHGDAATALDYGATRPSLRSERRWLTAAVLAEQRRLAPIEQVTVARTSRSRRAAAVRVRYRLAFAAGPQTVRSRLRLTERRGRWRLRRVAVRTRIDVAPAGQRARLAGAALPGRPVRLFPGAVPVSFDSPYLRAAPAAVRLGSSSAPTTVRARLSAAGRDRMAGAVRRALQRCLRASGASGASCPVPSGASVPGSLHGAPLGWVAGGLRIRLTGSAVGVLDARGRIPVRGRYREVGFRDRVRTTGGEVVVPVHAQAYAVAPLRIVWRAP
jgi:hypothetical protein